MNTKKIRCLLTIFLYSLSLLTFATKAGLADQIVEESRYQLPNEKFTKFFKLRGDEQVEIKLEYSDKKAKMKFITKGLLAIQLPCIRQEYELLRCGAHALENSKILADYKGDTKQDLESVIVYQNFKEPINKKVLEICEKLGRVEGKLNMSYNEVTILLGEEKAEPLFEKDPHTPFPEHLNWRFKIPNKNAYINVFVIEEDGTMRSSKKNFQKKIIQNFKEQKNIEIFMILDLAIHHWIAARVEKLRSGELAILFADSLDFGIDRYKKTFLTLAKQFGFYDESNFPTYFDETKFPKEEDKDKLPKLKEIINNGTPQVQPKPVIVRKPVATQKRIQKPAAEKIYPHKEALPNRDGTYYVQGKNKILQMWKVLGHKKYFIRNVK